MLGPSTKEESALNYIIKVVLDGSDFTGSTKEGTQHGKMQKLKS